MKLRTCKICSNRFNPTKPLQQWCSIDCAYKLSVERLKKSEIKRINESKKKLKVKLETKAGLMSEMQPMFNKIARLIDLNQPCISCGKFGKPQGGHFYASTNTPLRFNLHNIHLQCYRCNAELSGNLTGYAKGLSEVYGEHYFDLVKFDLSKEFILLDKSKDELKDAWKIAKQIVKELMKENREYSSEERMELRDIFNTRIGLYKK